MKSIRTYLIAVLLSAFLGGIGLSLVVKFTADRLGQKQSIVTQSAAAETSFALLKIQLDVLITISDLVFGSNMSHSRHSVPIIKTNIMMPKCNYLQMS